MQNKPGEIPILDNLRAVAAWSVCLYHFVCTTTGLINLESLLYRGFYFGQYGVHLFFIISGMVIPWSLFKNRYRIKSIGRFLLKRLLRLEPPYLFSIILVLLVLFLRRYSPTYDGIDREVTLKQVLVHLGYLVPFFRDVSWLNHVYWTLAIELQYYLVVGLLYFLFISPLFYIRCLGYVLLLAAPFIKFATEFLPFWLPLFGVGILLFQYKSQIITRFEMLPVLICFLAHLWFFNSATVAVVASLTALLILFAYNYSNRLLAFLGRSSYSVYLVHPVLGATFVNVFSHYVSGGFAKFMLVMGGVLITAVGSYIMYLIIEKPSRKLSSAVKY